MNDLTIHKAEGMDAILDCVSSPNDVIALDEKDVRDLVGTPETAFFVTANVQNVNDIKTAASNALEKLCCSIKNAKPAKLIFKITGENLSMRTIRDIASAIVTQCDEGANILWCHESSPGLGETINITLLIPTSEENKTAEKVKKVSVFEILKERMSKDLTVTEEQLDALTKKEKIKGVPKGKTVKWIEE